MVKTNLLDLDNDVLNVIGDHVKADIFEIIKKEEKQNKKNGKWKHTTYNNGIQQNFKTWTINNKDDYYKYTCLKHIKNNEILFIINCEYDAPKNECILNYYNQYWGNNEFNELLKKYK